MYEGKVAKSVQKEIGEGRARVRVTKMHCVKVWHYRGINLAKTKEHPSWTNKKYKTATANKTTHIQKQNKTKRKKKELRNMTQESS